MLMLRTSGRLLVLLPLLMLPLALCGWGTNNRADPFPLYTALDQQTFNYVRHKQLLHGWPLDKAAPERVTLSISGFGQAADSARVPCGGSTSSSSSPATCTDIPIGDIDGRWNILALLYGPLPQGQMYGPLLLQAEQALFPGIAPGQINDNFAQVIDSCTKSFGFVTNFVKYRKFGVRWNFEAQLIGDFGFQFQGGIDDVSQTVTARADLTTCGTTMVDCNGGPNACNTTFPVSGTAIKFYLTDRLNDIARELCLNICSFDKVSVEDLYFCLYWRHAHEVNFQRDPSWARFLVTPFFRIAGSVPSANAREPNELFSISVMNNGHPSIDANIGINFDFSETVEVGGEVGYSHFFARNVCNVPLPNSTFQSGIYPFKTSINLQPGDTWYAAAKVNAYHFIDRLNCYVQWVLVHHGQDDIRLLDCDPAFITGKCLGDRSKWRVQFINAAFNYDCSPNIALGFVWQFPIKWENAYKSNTVLFSFSASF